ncbi:ciliogenesis-associated TTC17-interacting protein-like [Stegodyphus dumicola]|uniref:ciliogenesis-associated TTC17-interacting protein-like n=1 Tax=Stegodyphus dumicola TaxID=202533 RepID=UPI0015A8BADC|nr:ciliogenesis-associated TTC17-interacting protein-like [Stegodyphus dumicola]
MSRNNYCSCFEEKPKTPEKEGAFPKLKCSYEHGGWKATTTEEFSSPSQSYIECQGRQNHQRAAESEIGMEEAPERRDNDILMAYVDLTDFPCIIYRHDDEIDDDDDDDNDDDDCDDDDDGDNNDDNKELKKYNFRKE